MTPAYKTSYQQNRLNQSSCQENRFNQTKLCYTGVSVSDDLCCFSSTFGHGKCQPRETHWLSHIICNVTVAQHAHRHWDLEAETICCAAALMEKFIVCVQQSQRAHGWWRIDSRQGHHVTWLPYQIVLMKLLCLICDRQRGVNIY